MQLIYGNDGTNYRTIAKSPELTEEQANRLLEAYKGFSYVRETSHYSDPSREPVSLTYVTTTLSGTMERKILLVWKARMTNYTTPSYYIHFRLLDENRESFGDGFFKLLSMDFLDSREITKYTSETIDRFEGSVSGYVPSPKALEKEVLVPLLAALLYAACKDNFSGPVRLILDTKGDDYNRCALDVITSLYTFLPYNIRMRCGFSTYAGAEDQIPGRVKLQLYAREARHGLKESYIDLASLDSKSILLSLPEEIGRFAKELVYMPEAERRKWFEDFEAAFGQEAASTEEHIAFYQNIRKWRNEPLDAMWDELSAYVEAENKNHVTSVLYPLFQSIIGTRVEKEGGKKSYKVLLNQALNYQGSFDFDDRMRGYLLLGEAIDCLEFCAEDFLEWEQNCILNIAVRDYPDERQRCEYLKSLSEGLPSAGLGGIKFQKVLRQMKDSLDREAADLETLLASEAEEEQNRLYQVVTGRYWDAGSYPMLKDIRAGIRFPENKTKFSGYLFNSLRTFLEKEGCLSSMAQYSEYKDFIERCRDLISGSDFSALERLLCKKETEIKEAERARAIVWNSQKDLIRTYREKAASNPGKTQTLIIANESYYLKDRDLQALLEYLLFASKERQLDFETLAGEQKGILQELLNIGAFDSRHMELLFRMAGGREEGFQKELIRYYLQDNILPSTERLLPLLQSFFPSVLERFGNITYHNVLSAALRQMVKKKGRGKEEGKSVKQRILVMGILLALLLAVSTAIWLFLSAPGSLSRGFAPLLLK